MPILTTSPPFLHTMLASKADFKGAQLSGVSSRIVRGRGGGDKELIEHFIRFSRKCLKNKIFQNKRYTDEASIFLINSLTWEMKFNSSQFALIFFTKKIIFKTADIKHKQNGQGVIQVSLVCYGFRQTLTY